MGAATCKVACVGKKYSKPTGKEPIKVIQRPNIVDLDSSIDDYSAHL